MPEITGTENIVRLNTDRTLKIILNTENLTKLLRSNISCHMNKILDQELIDTLTQQIIESIDYFLNPQEEIS